MYPHPEVVRVLAAERAARVRRQFRAAHEAKVARRARRRAQ